MERSFFSRLRKGLSQSTQKIGDNLGKRFSTRKLDSVALQELEDILIMADFGPSFAARTIQSFKATKFERDVTSEDIRKALAKEIAQVLEPIAMPFVVLAKKKPHVVLFVGVNGTGKTTTIGKFAHYFGQQGLKIILVAGDTFRAAAVEQLQAWGIMSKASVVVSEQVGRDPAGLAFEGLEKAKQEQADLLLIDTAGRLHNKSYLMEELTKIIRVLKKIDTDAPHSVLLVLDATTGQNALEQVRIFRDMVQVNGLIITKLDGSARGGVVVALADQFGIPVYAVGVGEKADDMRSFSAGDFAASLVGTSQSKEGTIPINLPG